MKKKVILIAGICFYIDFVSKYFFSRISHDILVIPNFFKISYVVNKGAAWNILNGQRSILIIIGVIVLAYIIRYIRNNYLDKITLIGFSLLIGGITGNLFDRIFYGYVRDFLSFKIINYNYPVFNMADVFIFMGIVLLIIDTVKGVKDGNSSKL